MRLLGDQLGEPPETRSSSRCDRARRTSPRFCPRISYPQVYTCANNALETAPGTPSRRDLMVSSPAPMTKRETMSAARPITSER